MRWILELAPGAGVEEWGEEIAGEESIFSGCLPMADVH